VPSTEPHLDEERGLIVRRFGTIEYLPTWQAMKAFTEARDRTACDELWLLEHPPVFTLGRAGRREHVLDPGPIPVVHVDRGGQVTYHGPGQAVAYLLLDIARLRIGVRQLVTAMEQAVIALLATHGVAAYARPEAPGVYVAGAKIAALGLRVRQGRTYHGLALNVDMDLAPFSRINPCGYPRLAITQLRDLGSRLDMDTAFTTLAGHLARTLGYVGIEPA
jgi:lipoyl(octanoyl) transferase